MGQGERLKPRKVDSTAQLTGSRRKFADLDYTVILVPTLKHFYAYQLVYPWCLFFIKASILALYYRIFSQTNFRYAVWVLTAIVAAVTLGIFFAYVLSNLSLVDITTANTHSCSYAKTSHQELGRLFLLAVMTSTSPTFPRLGLILLPIS